MNSKMSSDGAPAVHSNLVGTIPTWGPAFKVEFALFINSFDGPNLKNRKFAELLRFTSRDGNCCAIGDRIPAIFTDKRGFIQVATQIGTHGNKWRNVKLSKKTWHRLDILQYSWNNKVDFIVAIIDVVILSSLCLLYRYTIIFFIGAFLTFILFFRFFLKSS